MEQLRVAGRDGWVRVAGGEHPTQGAVLPAPALLRMLIDAGSLLMPFGGMSSSQLH